MRLVLTIQFCNRPCRLFNEHSCRLPIKDRSRLNRKLEMTFRNDIHTKAIEVNIQSSGIVEEEQICILPEDEVDENQLWQEKQNIRKQAQTETHNEPENNISELQQFHKPTSGLISCSSGYFKDNARIRLEQNNDVVFRNFRAKIEGNPFDENEMASDYKYQHILQNNTRIEIKQEVLTRKYYTDTGTISHYQILLPIQLLEEFLQALHGHNSNHPGITKMVQEARQKYYYPCMPKYIKNVSVTAKFVFKQNALTRISSEPNSLIAQNGISAQKTFSKWIFCQTSPQAEAMIISSRQSMSSQDPCSPIK